MKDYSVIKLSTNWSTETLRLEVENLINNKVNQGYEIVTVAFGINMWWIPTAFVTIKK